jgi:Phage major capsid protein E
MMLDIFGTDPAFSMTSLTMAMNKFPFMPGRIGALNLFSERRLSVITTVIEVRNNRLALIPSQPRGAPPIANVEDRRHLVPFVVPHFPIRDTVMADQVLGVRAFGTEDQLLGVQQVVDERLASMSRKHDVTLEWLRLGAVGGIVVTRVNPATGVPEAQIDLYDAFGMVQPPPLNWPIIIPPGAVTVPPRDEMAYGNELTAMITGMVREIANELGAGSFSYIHGIAGSVFMDAFAAHPEVRSTYLNQPAASALRDPTWMRQVAYREVIIEEYRGQIGNIPFVAPDQCKFFPVGVPDLFVEIYAPADYIEAVNTLALPRYAKQRILDFEKGVEMESQQNVLPMCTAPNVLRTAIATARP